MFIAIVGTRFSGKSSVEDYLISVKHFTPVRIIRSELRDESESLEHSNQSISSDLTPVDAVPSQIPISINKHLSFLSISSLSPPAPTSVEINRQPLCFSSPHNLLNYVTRNWQENFVTSDLDTRELVDLFVRRPFFLLLSIDAPLYERFRRSRSSHHVSLETFVQEDDDIVFDTHPRTHPNNKTSLQGLRELVNIHVTNCYPSVEALYTHLESLNLLDQEHLRPGWDAYFMMLASLASRRSNCMKRRVGAVLVRENRILSTGYNGTPRGLKNCNEGGCPQCNGLVSPSSTHSYECVCLHAEENALLEAGRERVGANAVLYCNTCPCLRCTVKIIQTGVKTVVYNLTYKVDDASASLFEQAGVQLRRYSPTSTFRFAPTADEAFA